MTRLLARSLPPVLWLLAAGTVAAAPPPTYAVTYLGRGVPVDIADSGIVAGNPAPWDRNANPWVWRNGVRTILPLPESMRVATARAVNSAGTVVGHAAAAPHATTQAVKWTPRNGRYVAELIPSPADGRALAATDINDAGVIVGVARTPGKPASALGRQFVTQPVRAFRLRPGGAAEVLDVLGEMPSTTSLVNAPQINEAGTVYDGVRTLLFADGRTLQVPPVAIGSGTYEFNGFLNDAGDLAGHVQLTSQSLPGLVVGVRYKRGSGWSRYPYFDMPHGALTALNAQGDAAYFNGNYAPGPSIEYAGVGHYAPQHLLRPDDRHWSIRGGALLNDRGAIVTSGRSARSGESGVLLLTPVAASR